MAKEHLPECNTSPERSSQVILFNMANDSRKEPHQIVQWGMNFRKNWHHHHNFIAEGFVHETVILARSRNDGTQKRSDQRSYVLRGFPTCLLGKANHINKANCRTEFLFGKRLFQGFKQS